MLVRRRGDVTGRRAESRSASLHSKPNFQFPPPIFLHPHWSWKLTMVYDSSVASRGRESKLSCFLPLIYSIYIAFVSQWAAARMPLFLSAHSSAYILKAKIENILAITQWSVSGGTDGGINWIWPRTCMSGKKVSTSLSCVAAITQKSWYEKPFAIKTLNNEPFPTFDLSFLLFPANMSDNYVFIYIYTAKDREEDLKKTSDHSVWWKIPWITFLTRRWRHSSQKDTP